MKVPRLLSRVQSPHGEGLKPISGSEAMMIRLHLCAFVVVSIFNLLGFTAAMMTTNKTKGLYFSVGLGMPRDSLEE